VGTGEGSSEGSGEVSGEGEEDERPSREGLPTADPRAEEQLLEPRARLGRHGIVSTDVGLRRGERGERGERGDSGEGGEEEALHGSAAGWWNEVAPGELGEHGSAEGDARGEGGVETEREGLFTPLLQPWAWRQGGRLRAFPV